MSNLNYPKEWETIKLKDIFEFKNGLNKQKKYFGHGTPIVNYVDVYKNRGLFKSDIKGLVEVNNSEIKNYNVKKGDVFFTRTSETVNEIGMSSVILDEVQDTVFSGFILRARPKKNNLCSNFAKFCFSSEIMRREIKEKSSCTTRALTSGTLLNQVNLMLPPLEEQKNIADILTTTDKLIYQINELIKQKKEHKKYLMKELLSGNIRLKGFIEEWKSVRLGDVCNITTGKLDANASIEDGEYRFYTCAKEYCYIDKYAFNTEALLISGNGANVGYIHYYNGKFNAYQRTYVLDKFKQNIKFIKQMLDVYLAKRINTEKSIGNTPYITLGTISNMKLNFPSFQEQTAIANILQAADKEIELLEYKLNEYKLLKKSLMQLLLTGTVRTIGGKYDNK